MDETELVAWAAELARGLGLAESVDVPGVLNLASTAAHTVVRPAAPVSTFVAGLLAGLAGGGDEQVAVALQTVERAVGPGGEFSRTVSSD